MIGKMLKNEGTKERSSEETNERVSKRIELKFMSEILIRLAKLKKICISGTTNGCSGNF